MEAIFASMMGALLIFLIISVLISVAIYIFLSLAFASMGKKAGLNHPNLAWIPGLGPFIVAFQASQMHWWPWILLIAYFTINIELAAVQIISGIALLVFLVYSVIWDWKLFEAIKRPGWWAILLLIPIVNLVIMAVAAWGKSE